MSGGTRDRNATVKIGVLAAEGGEAQGWTCGYLVINRYGRPLEFRCTAPIIPSGAQKILYGPTLREFVLGELAATALLQQSRNAPELLICDSLDFLPVRRSVAIPCVAVLPKAALPEKRQDSNRSTAHREAALGEYRAVALEEYSEDLQAAEAVVAGLHSAVDLLEPFERVVQALREGVRSAQGAA